MEALNSKKLRECLERNEEWLLKKAAVKAIIPRYSDPVGLVIVVKDITKALREEIQKRFKDVLLTIETGDTQLH